MSEIQPVQPSAPPGWYPDPAGSGHQRWWDGRAWGQFAPPASLPVVAPGYGPLAVRPPKDTAVAYVLWFFLAGLGIHNFYIGRTGPAVAQLCLTVLGWFTMWIGVGFLALFTVAVWVIVDAFLIPGYVRAANGWAR